MKHSLIKQLLHTGMILAAPALLLSSCFDDSYDLNDVDLTVGLGSEGLSVKLGNTEKILLGDILSVDESVKLDNSNLYYLVEKGSTDIEVNVDPVRVEFDIPKLDMKFKVLDYNKTKALLEEQTGIELPNRVALQIPADFAPTGEAEGNDNNTTITVTGISPEIKCINSLNFAPTTVSLKLRELKSPNVQFGIKQLRSAVIELPEMLHIVPYDDTYWSFDASKNTLSLKKPLPVNSLKEIKICEFVADGATNKKKIVNGELTLSNSVIMKGVVDFETTKAFSMGENDYASIELDFEYGRNLDIKEVNGRFDPAINPAIKPVYIADNLPDFLKDNEVRLDVSNPTIKFVTDMTNIPVGFDFSGQLTAIKNGSNPKKEEVKLNSIKIDNNKPHTIYYYQGDSPYDPEVESIPTSFEGSQVDNLGNLIREIPDYIDVNLNEANNKVKVQDKDYNLQLGHTYKTTAEYAVYVPFEFNKGLTIVYKDSTDSMKDDLKDYAAEGVRISATAENTIPLKLVASIEARDINNKIIPGIKFSTAEIEAGNGKKPNAPVNTDITIDGDLEDPTLLQKIDNFIFKINAGADENQEGSKKLISTQYLRLSNVRLRLKGIVIADLN